VRVAEVRIRSKGRGFTPAEIDAPDDVDDELGYAEIAVDALFCLADGLFEPLAVSVALVCCSAEFGYPLDDPRPSAPFHQLRLATVPEVVGIPDPWNGLGVRRAERLDRAAVLDWFATLLTDRHCMQQDTTTGWSELIVNAVRARLPEVTGRGVEHGSDELPVSEGGGVIRYPVERIGNDFWVAGPLSGDSTTVPFQVRIVNNAGSMYLEWWQNWSPWIEEDAAGRPDVDAATRRLLALGWELDTPGPA
jgi:hypothetical protein